MKSSIIACCVAVAAAQLRIEDLSVQEANHQSCMQRAMLLNNEKATFDPMCLNNGGLGCVKSNMGGSAFNGCRFCEFGDYSGIPCSSQFSSIGSAAINPMPIQQRFPLTNRQPLLEPVTTVQPVTTQEAVTSYRPVTSYETVSTQQPVTTFKTVSKQKPFIKYQPVQSFKTVTEQQPVTSYKTVTQQKPVVKMQPYTTFQPRTKFQTVTSYRPRMGSYSYQPPVSFGRSALYSQRPNWSSGRSSHASQWQRPIFSGTRRYGRWN